MKYENKQKPPSTRPDPRPDSPPGPPARTLWGAWWCYLCCDPFLFETLLRNILPECRLYLTAGLDPLPDPAPGPPAQTPCCGRRCYERKTAHCVFLTTDQKFPPYHARTPARTLRPDPMPGPCGVGGGACGATVFLWPQGNHIFLFLRPQKPAPYCARTPARTPRPDPLPGPCGAHDGATCVATPSCSKLS